MKCYKCGNQLPEDSMFCQYCGTDLSAGQYCKHCGEILKPGMKFCPKCGCKVEDQGECNIVFEEVIDTQEVSIADEFDETDISQNEESVQDEIPYISKQENASESTSGKRGSMKVLVIVLCLLLIAVGGCFFIGGKDKEVDISDLADNVLYLEVYDAEDNCIGSASGFLIDELTLVTNAHVIEDAYSMVAISADGKQSVEVNTVLSCDKVADIAILKCDEKINVSPLILTNSDNVKQGDQIYAIGYPLGVANTVSNGIVSSRYMNESGIELLKITAPISNGSSGGVLVDQKGNAIGVICAYYEGGQNMNIAITSNVVMNIFKNADEEGYRLDSEVSIPAGCVAVRINTTSDKYFADFDAALWKIQYEEHGIEPDAKLYIVEPEMFVEEVDAWCFDKSRKTGDIEVIENVYGYSICYFVGKGEEGVLKVGTSPDLPPLEYYNKEGELIGAEVDFMYAVAEEIGYSIEFIEIPFFDLMDSVVKGEVDCVASGLTETDERNRCAIASIPWYEMIGSDGKMASLVIYINDNNTELKLIIDDAIQKMKVEEINVKIMEDYLEYWSNLQ